MSEITEQTIKDIIKKNNEEFSKNIFDKVGDTVKNIFIKRDEEKKKLKKEKYKNNEDEDNIKNNNKDNIKDNELINELINELKEQSKELKLLKENQEKETKEKTLQQKQSQIKENLIKAGAHKDYADLLINQFEKIEDLTYDKFIETKEFKIIKETKAGLFGKSNLTGTTIQSSENIKELKEKPITIKSALEEHFQNKGDKI